MSRLRLATALLLLVSAACARSRTQQGTPAAPPPEVRVPVRGPVTALAVAPATLSFCDATGMHVVALPAGREQGRPGPCPATGLTAAGQRRGPEVTVRTPGLGPSDIVEVDGVAESFPIEGHARDWAASDDGAVVIVATATQVLRIDPAANRLTALSASGAERVAVAVDGAWAAWVAGPTIVARRL